MKLHIDGKEATYVAIEASKRDPIRVEPAEGVPADMAPGPRAAVAASTDGRKPPPRLRKPSPGNDQCLAPTGEVESHRARLRKAFGATLSDEFVEVLLRDSVRDACARAGRWIACQQRCVLYESAGLACRADSASCTPKPPLRWR